MQKASLSHVSQIITLRETSIQRPDNDVNISYVRMNSETPNVTDIYEIRLIISAREKWLVTGEMTIVFEFAIFFKMAKLSAHCLDDRTTRGKVWTTIAVANKRNFAY